MQFRTFLMQNIMNVSHLRELQWTWSTEAHFYERRWSQEGGRATRKDPVGLFSEEPACRAGFPAAQRTTAGSEWSRGESNPGPDKETKMLSTCLVRFILSGKVKAPNLPMKSP